MHTGSVVSAASHSLKPLNWKPKLSVHGDFYKNTEWVVKPSSGGLPSPGIKPGLPASPGIGEFFTTEPPRNPWVTYPTAKILLPNVIFNSLIFFSVSSKSLWPSFPLLYSLESLWKSFVFSINFLHSLMHLVLEWAGLQVNCVCPLLLTFMEAADIEWHHTSAT